jgi:hypothetical protein
LLEHHLLVNHLLLLGCPDSWLTGMRLLSGIATADLGLGLLLRSHLLLLNRLLCVNGLGRSLTECLHWLLDLI